MGTKVRSLYGVLLKSLIVTKPSPSGSAANSPEAERKASSERKKAGTDLAASPRFREALQTIVRLQKGGPFDPPVEEGLLQHVLRGFLVLDKYGTGASRDEWEKFWTCDTGKTWKALREFPDRLRRMAEEVEHVNRDRYFNLLAQKSDSMIAALPATLRACADCYDRLIRELPARTRAFYSHPSHEHPLWVGELSKIVKAITGRYCDREVAELLNAADLVLNPDKENIDKGWDAQTLADLRFRRKRRMRQAT